MRVRPAQIGTCILAAFVVAACSGDEGPQEPVPGALQAQVAALFPEGPSRDHAMTLAAEVASRGATAAGEAAAFDLSELVLEEYYAGRLGAAGPVDALITSALAAAGLADPGLDAASFANDGLVAVVRPGGGQFVTPSLRAGIELPAGAAPRTTLLVIARLADSAAYVPGDGPLPTSLDQYPLFFQFRFTPDVTLTTDGFIGICQFADPGSAYYPADGVFARLQLAHPDPADRSTIELLELVGASFLDCEGASAAAVAPAALMRRGGIGGRVRRFSPFAAVDPVPPVSTGQLGQDIEGRAAGDQAGSGVALSSNGRRMVVGSFAYDGPAGTNSGQARVFEYNGTAWVQLGADLDGEAPEDQFGGAVAISNDGSRVAIGSYLNDGGGNSSGHVRVFELQGSGWVQLGADIDGDPGRGSGAAVAMSANGGRVVVGGPGVGSVNGHVRVYDYSAGTWSELGPTFAGGLEYGTAVAMSADGNRIALSYPSSAGGNHPGTVEVWDWDGTAWSQVGAGIRGEALSDGAGTAISLAANGVTLAIGAPSNVGMGADGGGVRGGHVRVYRYSGGAWTQLGGDLDGASGQEFGTFLQLSGDGARLMASGIGCGPACIRLYTLAGTEWVHASSMVFGTTGRLGSVAISADGTVGAFGVVYHRGSLGAAQGVARAFRLP